MKVFDPTATHPLNSLPDRVGLSSEEQTSLLTADPRIRILLGSLRVA